MTFGNFKKRIFVSFLIIAIVCIGFMFGGCTKKDPNTMTFAETYNAFIAPITQSKSFDIGDWKATENMLSVIINSTNKIVDGTIVFEQNEKTTIANQTGNPLQTVTTDGNVKLNVMINKLKTDFFAGKGEGVIKLAIKMLNGKLFFNPEKVDFSFTSETPDDTLNTKLSSIKEMIKMYVDKWYVIDIEKMLPGQVGSKDMMNMQSLLVRKNAIKAFAVAQKIITQNITKNRILEQQGEKTDKGFPVTINKTGIVNIISELLTDETIKSFFADIAKQQKTNLTLPTQQEIGQNIQELITKIQTLGLSFYLKPVDSKHASLVLDTFVNKDNDVVDVTITPGKGGKWTIKSKDTDIVISWEIQDDTIPFSLIITAKTGADAGTVKLEGALGLSYTSSSFKGVLDITLSLLDFTFLTDIFDEKSLTVKLSAGFATNKKDPFVLQEPKESIDLMTLVEGLAAQKMYTTSGYDFPIMTGDYPLLPKNLQNN